MTFKFLLFIFSILTFSLYSQDRNSWVYPGSEFRGDIFDYEAPGNGYSDSGKTYLKRCVFLTNDKFKKVCKHYKNNNFTENNKLLPAFKKSKVSKTQFELERINKDKLVAFVSIEHPVIGDPISGAALISDGNDLIIDPKSIKDITAIHIYKWCIPDSCDCQIISRNKSNE